jgi:TonB-linked SusC/RagA family outer membrane protein
MKYYYLVFTCLMVMGLEAAAQDATITGIVTDENGTGMPGVNVVVKGTQNGTVTDADGAYTIMAPPTASLVYTFIGYKTLEEPVNSRTSINIALQSDYVNLQEVVVTGYASERRADIVSAVSTLSQTNTVAIPVPNVEQAIQGRVAGVQVITSGQPGATSQVRIRGFGSLGNNAPLYIVDGVPTYDVSNLNPYDIETTTVLKDAGAASIYGARAASGVIVYTTRHGSYDGTTKINFDMSTGLNFPGKGISLLDPQQQANKVYEALRNSGSTTVGQPYGSDINNPVLPDYINVGIQQSDGSWKPTGNIFEGDPALALARANANVSFSDGPIVQVVRANKSGTDWYKEMTRVAPVNRYSLGLSGGNDRGHYYANLAYYNQQGIAINQYLSRYNLRFNSEFKPFKNFRIGENLQLSYKANPLLGDQQSENQLNYAYRMPTIIPVKDENGNWAGTAAPGFNNPPNPVASLNRLNKNYNNLNTSDAFGNAYVELDPIKNLTLRSSFGGEVYYTYSLLYAPRTYENAENSSSNTLNESYSFQTRWIWTNTARYQRDFGDHSFTGLIGYEAIKDPAFSRNISGFGLNPFSSDPNFISLTNTQATGRQVNSGIPNQTRTLASYFGRIDYDFKDKYYLSATVRHDASSAFGVERRSGVFPAFSAGWRITSEQFMSSGTSAWLDDLKIRGGWGIMGNQNISPTNQYTLYAGGPANGYDIDGTNNSVTGGVIQSQVGNVLGRWEKNTTSNIGIDGTLFNGTLDIVLEFWQKNTNGLLYAPNVPATAGVFTNNPVINVASMVNKGIDLQIVERFKVGDDLSFVIDANISPLKNRITSLAPGISYFDAGTFRNLTFVRNAVDQPISSFFGYDMIGYFRDAQDVANSPKQDGAAPGRFKFRDVNGDGVITPEDRVFMGSAVPKFTYGLNLSVKYKAFSLDMFFYGKYGNKIINFSKWYNNFYQSFSGAALSSNVLQSWTAESPDNAKTPIMETASNFSTNTQANSWYMESGSYLRMRNIQLNYTFTPNVLNALHLKSMRAYLQAVNLFTITKYTGQDPEVASSVDTTLGVDVGNYPATRIWSLGLNIGF